MQSIIDNIDKHFRRQTDKQTDNYKHYESFCFKRERKIKAEKSKILSKILNVYMYI